MININKQAINEISIESLDSPRDVRLALDIRQCDCAEILGVTLRMWQKYEEKVIKVNKYKRQYFVDQLKKYL